MVGTDVGYDADPRSQQSQRPFECAWTSGTKLDDVKPVAGTRLPDTARDAVGVVQRPARKAALEAALENRPDQILGHRFPGAPGDTDEHGVFEARAMSHCESPFDRAQSGTNCSSIGSGYRTGCSRPAVDER